MPVTEYVSDSNGRSGRVPSSASLLNDNAYATMCQARALDTQPGSRHGLGCPWLQ